MSSTPNQSFASRGGLKLDTALAALGISPSNLTAADFGSATGGFVDVLLRRGAKKVYAVEKGFGRLAWSLRKDPRVIVLEREDATQVVLPEQVDLITIDIGFTRQRQIVSHALSQLGPKGLIVSLIKPQYEVSGRELVKGRLTDALSEEVFRRTVEDLRQLGISVLKSVPSMVRGKDANALEFFVLLRSGGSPG